MQVQIKIDPKAVKPVIPDKWGPAIWLLLFVASMLRNVVSVASSFSEATEPAEITYALIMSVLADGVIPMAVCYVFSLILFTMSVRRRAVFCRRNDFVYICMLFTSAAYFVMGIIECFAFLEESILPYTTMLLNMTVLTGAYCAMFFAVFAPKMDLRKKYLNFVAWASLYLGLQGLVTVFSSVSYIVIVYDDAVSEALTEILEAYYGLPLTLDDGYATASIIALAFFGGWVIAATVVAILLQKKAKDYVPPAPVFTSFTPPPAPSSPFEELNGDDERRGDDDRRDGGSGGGKVFDEFDL